MKVVFRADGSHERGMGHIYRCLSLAAEFSGWDAWFLSRPEEVAKAKVSGSGFEFLESGSVEDDFRLLDGLKPDVIVADILSTEEDYMEMLRSLCRCLVTFDDEGPGSRHADLVFNVLYNSRTEADGQRVFTSPEYIILNRVYQGYAGKEKAINDQVSRILVTQGGSDTRGRTAAILEALDGMDVACPLRVDVVIGPAFVHDGRIGDLQSSSRHDIAVHEDVPSLAGLIFDADVVICSGGVTAYEVACIGTPMIILCQESMEVETAERIADMSAAVNLGDRFIKQELVDSLVGLISDPQRRRAMSEAQRRYVSAFGARNIKDLVMLRLDDVRSGDRR